MAFFSISVKAQLFPGKEGEELADAIRQEFTPTVLLNDTQVKDTLYSRVFREGDSVRCIYSGLAHHLPDGVDPSQYIYENGNQTNSMNLEHAWPQSKGAGDGQPGNMNMYHLFPSRVAINSDRADHPYNDINDNQTNHWYYLGTEQSQKPTSNIDAYSEYLTNVQFEPRESVKGDIARAMFYFWTIYRDDAMAEDPGFFSLMRESLCAWHEADPVDDFEELRNERIALYQGGKSNPFILDCSLAKRTYCNQLPDCEISSAKTPKAIDGKLIYDSMDQKIILIADDIKEWRLAVFNSIGQKMYSELIRNNASEPLQHLVPGIYYAMGSRGQQQCVISFFVN